MQFSQILAECMANRGMNAYRLSKKIDVHPTTIRNWLDGKTEPKIQIIPKLAEALGVSVEILLGTDTSKTYHTELTKEIKRLLEEFDSGVIDGVLKDHALKVVRCLARMFNEFREIAAYTDLMPNNEDHLREVIVYVRGLSQNAAKINAEIASFVEYIQNMAITRINEDNRRKYNTEESDESERGG